MKLYCTCGKFMGELTKGAIRHHAVIMCWECQDEVMRLREKVGDVRKDIPDFLAGLFGNNSRN